MMSVEILSFNLVNRLFDAVLVQIENAKFDRRSPGALGFIPARKLLMQ